MREKTYVMMAVIATMCLLVLIGFVSWDGAVFWGIAVCTLIAFGAPERNEELAKPGPLNYLHAMSNDTLRAMHYDLRLYQPPSGDDAVWVARRRIEAEMKRRLFTARTAQK